MAESGVPDPMALWKQMVESQEQVMSKSLQDMMGTEAFAASMGKYLDGLFNVQGVISKALEQHYRTLNLPSRSDVTRLAGEVAELRAAVDRLDEKIDVLASRLPRSGDTSTRAKPPAPAAKSSPVGSGGKTAAPSTRRSSGSGKQSRASDKRPSQS